MRIAINGCGVAGPALAFWLLKAGHEPTLIEEAHRLRTGGYVIDFWGIGYDIAEKMGLMPRIRDAGYQVQEVRFLNSRGRRVAGFSTGVFHRMTGGRFTSLRRSDLGAALFSAVEGKVETIFGDSVATIEEHVDSAHVTFDHAAPRAFDLVIGADGLHSRIRQIAFGPERQFEVDLGFHVAAFEVEGYRPRDELVYVSYAPPGRQVSRLSMRDDRTLFLFVFRNDLLDGWLPPTNPSYKTALRRVFGEDGWECPQILAAMEAVTEIYFDRVSQIRMDAWAKGRVALVGDAAAGVSLLAGEGTGLAIAEAYVLAGELAPAGDDYRSAFAAYQDRVMPFLRRKQESARKFASTFAPATLLGIKIRNFATKLLRFPPLADLIIGRALRDDVELPDYPWR